MNDKGQRYYADFLTNEIKKHYLGETEKTEPVKDKSSDTTETKNVQLDKITNLTK